MQLAPVEAQIVLAKKVGENVGDQQYLVTIEGNKGYVLVGGEQARALRAAEVKVIANTGRPAEGMTSAMDLFTAQGGTHLASAVAGAGPDAAWQGSGRQDHRPARPGRNAGSQGRYRRRPARQICLIRPGTDATLPPKPGESMTKGRIEAFSDGVLAIIITIMVLELKVPHGHDLAALQPLIPVFLGYVLSFLNVGIYWNNHHHLFHAVKHVGGWVLWANLHLLFWLSLMPFATAFMGENGAAPGTVVIYCIDILMCAVAFHLLTLALVAEHGKDSDFARALGSDRKGKISLAIYLTATALAFVQPVLSLVLIAAVACIWIVPDRRFAKAAHHT